MKVRVIDRFRYEGEVYEEGAVVDLPDSVVESVIEKGYGRAVEGETPTIEGDSKEKTGPEWKRKVWISEDRNLTISVWPRGGKFDSPSITLEESRRDESGEWDTNRIYLPTGSSLLALSEHMRSSWEEIQKMKSEQKEEPMQEKSESSED